MKTNLRQEKELIRSDLNLERWEIFTTRFYAGKSREIVKYEDGKETKVIIGRKLDGIETGVLTATDGKIFYTLLKFWDEQGRPDNGRVIFITRQLLQRLRINSSPGKKCSSQFEYQWIEKHLDRLKTIPICWIESYEREGIKMTKEFTLVNYYRLFERKKDDPNRPYFGFSEVKINEEIVKTLKTKNIKLLRLDVIRKLKSDIAFLLYRWLDLMLYSVSIGDTYNCDLMEVAKICGVEKQPSHKIKQQIQKAIKELEGKELTKGMIKNIRIEKSNIPSSWRLVIEKSSLLQAQVTDAIDHPELLEIQTSPEQELAKELVYYFYEELGRKDLDGEIVKPTSLELSQAAKLINEYGFEWSKELVEYTIVTGWPYNCGFDYVLTFLDKFKEYKDQKIKEKLCQFKGQGGYHERQSETGEGISQE